HITPEKRLSPTSSVRVGRSRPSEESATGRGTGADSGDAGQVLTPRKVSFWDVGHLLSPSDGHPGTGDSGRHDPGLAGPAPPPTLSAGSRGVQRGSTAVLRDLGGLLSTPPPP